MHIPDHGDMPILERPLELPMRLMGRDELGLGVRQELGDANVGKLLLIVVNLFRVRHDEDGVRGGEMRDNILVNLYDGGRSQGKKREELSKAVVTDSRLGA